MSNEEEIEQPAFDFHAGPKIKVVRSMYTMVHDLKCWPPYFKQVKNSNKPFEIRLNDREFRTGDKLVLREYDPEKADYTGKVVVKSVSYILDSHDGLKEGYVIMGLEDPL